MGSDVFGAYGIAYDRSLDVFVGKYSGKCVVVGTGWSMWDDLLAAGFVKNAYRQPFTVIAINRAVQDLPCFVDHGYSNHAKLLKVWHAGRDEVHQKKDKHAGMTILHSNRDGVDVNWKWPGWGTSTMGGLLMALAMGFDDISVCGMPMDNGGHYYDPPWHETNFENDNNERVWQQAAARVFHGKVKIISGRFKELGC